MLVDPYQVEGDIVVYYGGNSSVSFKLFSCPIAILVATHPI